jgi:thiol-disulfide isomerase/thioredoxin
MKLLVAIAITCLLAACQPSPQPPESAPSKPSATAGPQKPAAAPVPGDAKKAGAPDMPTLQVATLDGGSYDLAADRGRWVVVNFWATWCSPCLKEMPELSALDAMREHVEVVGLAYEEIEPDALRAFLRKHPVVYPIAIVDVYDPPRGFETPRGLPMTYLIAPDGRVAKQFLGPVTAKDIESAIAAAGGPKPTA